MVPTLLNSVDCVMDKRFGSSPPLSLANMRYAVLFTILLLDIGIPHFDFMRLLNLLGCHQVFLVHRIDIYAKVLAHQPYTESVGEAADFVRLASHRATELSDMQSRRKEYCLPVDHVRISNDRCNLRVTIAPH